MSTTTTLIHRAYAGPVEWWRDSLVYEIASPELGAEQLGDLGNVCEHVVSLGFGTVLIRPSRLASSTDMAEFRRFAARAHEQGLRVIARISGALGPVTGLHAHEANPILVGRERGLQGLVERAGCLLRRKSARPQPKQQNQYHSAPHGGGRIAGYGINFAKLKT